jgi:4-amino-4-deoxy-L-arabinose transferase-like glycosyltransferase
VLLALAALFWIAALPAVGLFDSRAQRLVLFAGGAALVAIAFGRKPEKSRDPGPYERGLGSETAGSPPSLGLLVLITAVALVLRCITLGRPVDGDDFEFLGWWKPQPANPFVARLPLAVCGALTPACLYTLIRRATGEPAALLAAALLAVAPAHVTLSQTVGADAPAVLIVVLASLILFAAIAQDSAPRWWLYGLLLVAAVFMGPWSTAIFIGHALVVLGWGLLRRLAGYPAPPLRRFLLVLVLSGTFLGLFLAANWRDAGSTHPWIWYPMGVEHGAIPTLVWILAAVGLTGLVGRTTAAAAVYLILGPAACAWLLAWLSSPYEALTALPWPVLPALVTLTALGAAQLLKAGRVLLGWVFPGRIPVSTQYNLGMVLAAALLAMAILPGLKRHYHRSSPIPANAEEHPDSAADHR